MIIVLVKEVEEDLAVHSTPIILCSTWLAPISVVPSTQRSPCRPIRLELGLEVCVNRGVGQQEEEGGAQDGGDGVAAGEAAVLWGWGG